MKRGFRYISLTLVLLLVYFALGNQAAFAYRGNQMTLRVTTVIDNIDEVAGLSNMTTFTYEVRRITGMATYQNNGATYPNPSRTTNRTINWRHNQSQNLSFNRVTSDSNMDTFLFKPAATTNPQLSLSYVEYVTRDFSEYVYNDAGRARVTASADHWLSHIRNSSSAEVILHFRYNPTIDEAPPAPDPEPDHSKTIDYLGDGFPNPDTRVNGENDYRLYLDVTTEAVEDEKERDIILVLDVSTSMEGRMNNGQSRFQVLVDTVRTTVNALTQNDKNRISIIQFGTNTRQLAYRLNNRTQLNQIVNAIRLPGGAEGGTNYYDGLLDASQIINNNINTGGEKVVFFITDGQPTAATSAVTRLNGYDVYGDIATLYAQLAISTLNNVDRFYSVYIGTEQGNASNLQSITQKVNVSNEKYMVQATSAEEVSNALARFVGQVNRSLFNLTINDVLSDFVDYTGELKVTRTTGSSNPITLAAGTDYTFQRTGKNLSVRLLDGTLTNSKYEVSFNVTASDEAINDYYNHADYPHVGDAGTDYGRNATSSGQPGYYSNDRASVSYNYSSSGVGLKSYAKPVIQVVEPGGIPSKATLEKSLVGKDLEADMFEFEVFRFIEAKDEEEEDKLISIGRVKNDIDGFINLDVIEYNRTGVFKYKVKEIIPTVGMKGMTYDDSVLTVVTTVRVQGGDLVADIEYPDGKVFKNVYKPLPVNVVMAAIKQYEDAELLEGAFDFRLLNGSGSTVSIVGNALHGAVIFPPVTFDKVGTFRYTIKEVIPSVPQPNTIYDTREVPVDIVITDNNGQLEAKVEYPQGNIFVNRYVYTSVDANIDLKLILTGMRLTTGMFDFELEDEAGTIYDSYNEINGDVRFTVTFDEEGDYKFKARQIIPTEGQPRFQKNMTYDDKEMEITVKVRKVGGAFGVEIISEDGGIFYNRYKIKGEIW